MKPMLATIEMMKQVATTRSAFLARTGSSGPAGSSRGACGGPSPWSAARKVLAVAGGGVPITRCGPAWPSSAGWSAAGPPGPAG